MLENSEEIYNIYNDNKNNIREGEEIELEVKYGNFYINRMENKGYKFINGVPYVYYKRVIDTLRKEKIEEREEESTVYQINNIRKITKIREEGKEEEVIWQEKTKIYNKDYKDYNLRVTINKEKILKKEEIERVLVLFEKREEIIRERSRISFIKENIKIDLTDVMMTTKNGKIKRQYEIEVEYIGKNLNIKEYIREIEEIFKIINGTKNIYKTAQKKILINNVNKILGGEKEYTIDKNLLVQARNIKKRDLVYGGIVGSETNYMITYKADGLRKMLIIDITGIWLVYPPYEFNLVILNDKNNLSKEEKFLFEKVNYSIFDGELINSENNEYRYLVFDTLAINGKANVQNQNYIERSKYFNILVKTLIKGLKVETKRTEEIKTVESFFSLVKDFLDNRNKLNYLQDGIMFIPKNARYNHNNEKIKLHRRALTRYPDICKYKELSNITIDFLIKWKDNRTIELYSFDEAVQKDVKFEGDIINPLTPNMIDHQNELTKNIRTGQVVEYKYVNGLLIPERIRYDKTGANKLSIALDNWSDIHNPIKYKDIIGETLMMSFSYHNRIKKYLYSYLNDKSDLLDIGSGAGGDISKWFKLGKILAVDPNSNNLNKFKDRLANADYIKDRIYILETGGENYNIISDKVKSIFDSGKVDAISLMLSLSFFWSSEQTLNKLIKTIISTIKPGGKILFFTINGDVVEQTFEPIYQQSNKKKSISILDSTFTLFPSDNNIASSPRSLEINLPNTIVGLQTEYLVFINDLVIRLKKYGFNLKFHKRANDEKLLSSSNKLYTNFFSYGVFEHNSNISLSQDLQLNKTTSLDKNLQINKSTSLDQNLQINKSTSLDQNLQINKSTSLDKNLQINKTTYFDKKLQINKSKLNMLYVNTFSNSIKALNDDTYAPLKCKWSKEKIVRISTIGDGTCLFHALLKSFYDRYQNDINKYNRMHIAATVRRDLGLLLSYENPKYKGYSYWFTISNGSFPRMLMLQLKDPNLINLLNVDYSLQGLQYLFNSSYTLGDEVYSYIGEILKINIFILLANEDNLEPIYTNFSFSSTNKCVVIIGNTCHYEVLALNNDNGLQTVFSPNHPFIKEITTIFPNIPNDDFNPSFDPDQSFIKNFREIFSTPNGILLPQNFELYFPKGSNDPFRKAYDRNLNDIAS